MNLPASDRVMSPEREAEARLNHTPTPWRVFQFGGVQIGTMAGESVCSMWGDEAEGNANAEFIVRACNSHEALVKALTDAIDAMDSTTDPLDFRAVMKRGRAALRLAASEPSITTEAAE